MPSKFAEFADSSPNLLRFARFAMITWEIRSRSGSGVGVEVRGRSGVAVGLRFGTFLNFLSVL